MWTSKPVTKHLSNINYICKSKLDHTNNKDLHLLNANQSEIYEEYRHMDNTDTELIQKYAFKTGINAISIESMWD